MLKKLIITIALSLFATAAFAAAAPAALKGFAQSKNVDLDYAKGPASCTNGCDRWAAITQHKSADKNYFTSSAYGSIALKTVTPGDAIGTATAPNTSTDSAVPTGWLPI